MSENDTSLYYNLTQCLRSLRKIREIYKNAPVAILEHLANTEEVIALCQCASVEDDFGASNPTKSTSRTYWYILENLIEVSTPRRLPLQLYFCRSPYWEHYDRNMTEIMLLLDKILLEYTAVPPRNQRSRKISAASSDSSSDNDFGEVERFRRRFVPFAKVVSDRQWAGGWRQTNLVL